MHTLDLNFHKAGSKNTVFAINRALRSIDSGMRFFLGFFAQVGLEAAFLIGTLTLYCGPKYLFNVIIVFLVYTAYTTILQKKRI